MIKVRRIHKSLVLLRVGSAILIDQQLISDQVINHFQEVFTKDSSIVNTGLVEKVIPSLFGYCRELNLAEL